MACGAKCDEILFRVAAESTPEFDVMNFKVGPRATGLALPSVATKDLQAQFAVSVAAQLDSRTLGQKRHEAFLLMSARNASWYDFGRNL
jgi:hypothetical protein